jgi:hypothetical protein
MGAESGVTTPLSAKYAQAAIRPDGEKMKTCKIARVIAICFYLALISQFAQSQANAPHPKALLAAPTATVSVVGGSMYANGVLLKHPENSYEGSCPVNLKFTWTLLSTEPTEVSYSTQRSDDGISATKKVKIPTANSPVFVSEPWEMGANTPRFKDFKGSIALTTKSPNKADLGIYFTIHCK